jgi:hypothetical protein
MFRANWYIGFTHVVFGMAHRAEQFANTPAGKAAHKVAKVAKARTSLAPNRGGEPGLKVCVPNTSLHAIVY